MEAHRIWHPNCRASVSAASQEPFRDIRVIHGFLLSKGRFTTIDPPGANLTVAFHINPDGVITGAYRTSNGSIHGFLLSNGEFITIQKTGTTFTVLDGINPKGDITGEYRDSSDNIHSFLLSNNTFMAIV